MTLHCGVVIVPEAWHCDSGSIVQKGQLLFNDVYITSLVVSMMNKLLVHQVERQEVLCVSVPSSDFGGS